jgi:hypothetical protein
MQTHRLFWRPPRGSHDDTASGGRLFVFPAASKANPIKIVFWDGTGLCLFTKRLEHGVFLWLPSGQAWRDAVARLSRVERCG